MKQPLTITSFLRNSDLRAFLQAARLSNIVELAKQVSVDVKFELPI